MYILAHLNHATDRLAVPTSRLALGFLCKPSLHRKKKSKREAEVNTPLYLWGVGNIKHTPQSDTLHHPHALHDALDKSEQIRSEDSALTSTVVMSA